ncbi:MAG: hypothetical protein M3Q48_11550 [Actinomycetota bacterium]|nr:hypothetical protein [Actinomycetota bacterium]
MDPFTVSLHVRARIADPIATDQHFINFPNLRITSSAAAAQPWINWHDDFVVKGNNGKDQERRGSFVFLTGDLQNEAARIDLFQLGIFRLSRSMDTAEVDTVTADIYCERMEFHGAEGGRM